MERKVKYLIIVISHYLQIIQNVSIYTYPLLSRSFTRFLWFSSRVLQSFSWPSVCFCSSESCLRSSVANAFFPIIHCSSSLCLRTAPKRAISPIICPLPFKVRRHFGRHNSFYQRHRFHYKRSHCWRLHRHSRRWLRSRETVIPPEPWPWAYVSFSTEWWGNLEMFAYKFLCTPPVLRSKTSQPLLPRPHLPRKYPFSILTCSTWAEISFISDSHYCHRRLPKSRIWRWNHPHKSQSAPYLSYAKHYGHGQQYLNE